MIELLKAAAVGTAVGFAFASLRLPVPAPATAAGVAGVVGLWAGYLIARRVL